MPEEATYVEAIRSATELEMAQDPRVVLFGLDVDDPKCIQGTTAGLLDRFGSERVFGTPLAEEAMTGAAVGMALSGLRPIHVHIRIDFVLLAMNQLINVAAKTRYMHGGKLHVPMVVRAMIGKSWGQGAQHSQGLYPLFMHIPGLKVCAPSTPYDAMACLLTAIRDDDPVIIVEHRLLYYQTGPLPEDTDNLPAPSARVTRPGKDVTLVGISHQQEECLRAAAYWEEKGLSAEVIDPIWLTPLDLDTIETSVRKTGALCVVDNTWTTCGAGSEIIAGVLERIQGDVPVRVKRLGYAPVTCPPTPGLEELFYPNGRTIARDVCDLVHGGNVGWTPEERANLREITFKGPF